jgi:multicomponent Na+:H+ antiporter subunit G
MTAVDIVASVALIGGAALSFIAGVAVLRFPDAATRVHAATKPQVLGIVLLTIGLGLRLGSIAIIGEFVLIVLLQLFTAPVGAHLAVRQAFARGDVQFDPPSAPSADPDSVPGPADPVGEQTAGGHGQTDGG